MNWYSVTTYRKLVNYNQKIKRKIYRLCYNYDLKSTPYLWYKLYKSKINKTNIRKRFDFIEDPLLPDKYRVKNSDYSHSEYDKGHLAPDASFDYSEKSLKETYFLTNIIPQKPKLNREFVATIEKYERLVAIKLGYLYVVCLNKYDNKTTIGDNVHVPIIMYKILINKKHKFLRIFKYAQTDKGYKIKNNLITLEELKKDFGIGN